MFGVNTSWSWIKQIPLTATVAAAAAAALSMYSHDESSTFFGGGSSHKGNGSRRVLTWSDEHGMSLTEIINPSQALFPQSSSVDADTLKTMCDDADGASDISTNASENGTSECESGSTTLISGCSSFGITLSEATLQELDTQEFNQMEADKLEEENQRILREQMEREQMESMSPVSPQWGWYVSITPPQHMYQDAGTPGTPPRSLTSR